MKQLILIAVLLPLFGQAQITFTKITDPNNAITQQIATPGYAGVTWIDYNGDGWEDCFVNSNSLYRNRQDGSFEKVFFSDLNFGLGNGASWGDFDGDGDPDVMISASPTRLYRNDQDSFNLVSNYIDSQADTNFNFWSSAWGDFDGDNWLDIALIHPANFLPNPNAPASRPSILLKNNKDGTFSYVNTPLDDELAAHTVGTWTDFDRDGDLDLMVGSGEVSAPSKDHLFINQLKENGKAGLSRLESGPLANDERDGQNWNFIDVDLDGDLDAYITNYNPQVNNQLYLNENGNFVLQGEKVGCLVKQQGNGLGNIWVDFDNDGYLDCFVTFDGNQEDHYYHNNGDGTFSESKQAFNIKGSSRGAAAGDYDNDGFMDLMIASATQGSQGFYRNEGNDNQWFHLKLEGKAPNSSAIGAKVYIKSNINGASKWQYREVNAQNAFNGHNSLRVHFGLAQSNTIDSLKVIWPDGEIQTAQQISSNQICTWKQGEANPCQVVVNTKKKVKK